MLRSSGATAATLAHREWLKTFDWKDKGLAREFGRQADMFCTISYQETWEPIRLKQKENGVVYELKDLQREAKRALAISTKPLPHRSLHT